LFFWSASGPSSLASDDCGGLPSGWRREWPLALGGLLRIVLLILAVIAPASLRIEPVARTA
jgi:hypothetical protein